MVRNIDSCYFRSHCPSQNTFAKMQTQGLTTKESKSKESRPKDSKPANEKTLALPWINNPKNISCQDKKKKYLKKKQDRKNSTPATENNAIEDEKKQNDWRDRKYYHCQKKSYFAKNCFEILKSKCQSW